MPLLVVCLVPAAPVLLPHLAGTRVPEVEPVRDAARRALAELSDLDRVVVVTDHVPGTLAGFGAPGTVGPALTSTAPTSGGASGSSSGPSWPAELADALLDAVPPRGPGAPAAQREHRRRDALTPPDRVTGLVAELERDPARVGLLLLADGSRTRGPRAPGGEDPRGDVVDAELLQALRQGRAAHAPDAVAVGATAVEAVALLAAAPGGPTVVLHHEAPLGVTYLVALRRRRIG